jgi:hypothetical protein
MYTWFLDKVDGSTLHFPSTIPYMIFNKRSMKAMYHARYPQIRDVQIDFIRLNHVRQ